MSDRTTEAVAGAAGAVVAGGVAADQFYRVRARRLLGKDFSPEAFSRLNQIARQRVLDGYKQVDGGQAGSVRRYTDYDNRVINRYLRTGDVTRIEGSKLVKVADPAERARLERSYSTAAQNVNRAVGSQTLPQGTKLFRATGTKSMGVDLKPGATFSDKAIQSTTRSMSQADPFYRDAKARGAKPVMMVIDAGGKKGLSLESFSKFGYEREVAMPSNSTYKVDRVATGVKRHLFDRPRDYAFVSVAQQVSASPVADAGAKLAMPKAWVAEAAQSAAKVKPSFGSKLGFAAAAAAVVGTAAVAMMSRGAKAEPQGAFLDDKAKAASAKMSEPAAARPTAGSSQGASGSGPIDVPGYTRADGVQVKGYTRQRVN